MAKSWLLVEYLFCDSAMRFSVSLEMLIPDIYFVFLLTLQQEKLLQSIVVVSDTKIEQMAGIMASF